MLIVGHELAVRYIAEAAAGANTLGLAQMRIANASPFLFDDTALRNAVERLDALASPADELAPRWPHDAAAATTRPVNAAARHTISADMGGFDSQLAVRGEATEQDDMAPARAALWLLMPAPRRVVSVGYELAAAGVIRAAATRRACSAGPGVPCCLVRKMWCRVPVRVSASVSVSALAAILPSFCSASR
jgi:hypothetical protein